MVIMKGQKEEGSNNQCERWITNVDQRFHLPLKGPYCTAVSSFKTARFGKISNEEHKGERLEMRQHAERERFGWSFVLAMVSFRQW